MRTSYASLFTALMLFFPVTAAQDATTVVRTCYASLVTTLVLFFSVVRAQDAKIVGGSPASPGEYPFYVSRLNRSPQGRCGASLIHPSVALTAAHCGNNFDQGVTVGDYNLNLQPSIAVGVQERVIHPSYNGAATDGHDIMLLHLSQPVTSVQPIPYVTNGPIDNEQLTVIGFGATAYQGSQSDVLLEVNVNAFSNAVCGNQYGSLFKQETMFCAAVNGGGKDSCQGDSGGPIMDASGTQVGIVSWGLFCADPNYAGVYTRVSQYSSWIQQQIFELTGDDGTTPPPPPPPVPPPPPTPTPPVTAPTAPTPGGTPVATPVAAPVVTPVAAPVVAPTLPSGPALGVFPVGTVFTSSPDNGDANSAAGCTNTVRLFGSCGMVK